MSFEMLIGVTMLRWLAFGYIVYRIASKINWPLFYFYLCGGDK